MVTAATGPVVVAAPIPALAPAVAPTVPGSEEASTGVNPSKRTRDNQGREPRKRSKYVSSHQPLVPCANMTLRRDFTSTITVLAGAGFNIQQFTVHEDRICNVSPFFTAACSKDWLEGQTGTVKLPTVRAKFFRHYIEWVYSGRMELEELKEMQKEKASAAGNVLQAGQYDATESVERTEAYCMTWMIADYLGDVACKNACIAHLTSQLTATNHARIYSLTINAIAENTTPESGLFRWMVDDICKYLVNFKPPEKRLQWLGLISEVVKDEVMAKAFASMTDSSFRSFGKLAAKYAE